MLICQPCEYLVPLRIEAFSMSNLLPGPAGRNKKSQARRRQTSLPPPEFWDTLFRVPLSKNALRELDRRNALQPVLPNRDSENRLPRTADIKRFSRVGGPDLQKLRGVRIVLFLHPSNSSMPLTKMPSFLIESIQVPCPQDREDEIVSVKEGPGLDKLTCQGVF